MHTLMRFTLVCVCVCATVLIIGVREAQCEDVSGAEKAAEDAGVAADADADAEGKSVRSASLPDTGRRGVAGGGGGGAGTGVRDSQLLSLAARRRQLFSERLNQHIQAITAIVHPPNRTGTTLTQPDQRNSSIALAKKVLSVDDGTGRGSKLTAVEGAVGAAGKLDEVVSKELTRLVQDNKPSMAMKLYQDPRSRAGFLNNRRKESEGARTDSATRSTTDESEGNGRKDSINTSVSVDGVLNAEKLEGPEQEVVLDPDEEFQVDESSHGIYLLNFSDSSNVTDINKNKIIADNETKESILGKEEFEIVNVNVSKETNLAENGLRPNGTILDASIKIISPSHNTTMAGPKIENAKDSENKTLFMSDEIYNHFRPLESELRAEDMAKFLFFGQKLSTPILDGENLTNSPSFSASTKSVNLISPPIEKKRYTSRYSAIEKNKNGSVGEDEINEDMDVSVVKNVIEKNKIRNSVKGPAPARHISLLNAYRKPLSPATVSKVLNPVLNVTLIDETRSTNYTNREQSLRSNYRNISRNYFNTRRRPIRVTTVGSVLSNPENTTTEKSSTLVYTAVVTSVSITSSMKGQNKTELTKELGLNNETKNNEMLLQPNSTTYENTTLDETETITARSSSTIKPRLRSRIRTTTERSSNEESVFSSTPFILVNRRQTMAKLHNIPKPVNESETSFSSNITFPSRSNFNTDASELSSIDVIGTRLSLDGILTIDQRDANKSEAPSTLWPSTSVLKMRRRPTTTTITSTIRAPTTQALQVSNAPVSNESLESTVEETEQNSTPSLLTTNSIEESHAQDNDYHPNEKTHDNEPMSNEQDLILNFTNITHIMSSNHNNIESVSVNPNEEVVIEAEKNYTASYVLAGLGFLPVTAIVVFVLRNVFLKKTKELDTDYEGYFDEEPKKESPIIPVARPAMPLPAKPDRKWEFPRNKLRLQTLLGQGNFGQVWKAEADDLSGHDGLTRLVAVKTIKDTATQKEKQELLHEICIMQKLGSHPNVVTLLACCTEQEPYLLIMEYVMCGKLLTYLRERRSRPDRFGGSGTLTSRDLTVFAYCVARGMEYLASKGVVHRDLAARNVLVDHNKLCKIADFGMSREMCTSGEGGESCAGGAGSRSQRHALPVRWMAPEALLYNVFNHETDVWAYGILLWEIVTLGSTPYAAMSGREVLQVVTEGYRLERPAHCKPALYRTMHACWHAAPAQRPSFVTIKSQLADLLDNEPSEGNYVDLDSFYQDSSVYSDPSAIIPDDADGEYTAPPPPRNHVTRASSAAEFDARFGFPAPPPMRHDFIGSPRMSGFGIRDCGFGDCDFERSEGERENSGGGGGGGGQLGGGRNSFSGGLQRLSSRGRELRAFQLVGDSGGGGGRNKRVPEFECDI